MAKVIGIIEDSPVTGVKYGEIEVPEQETEINHAQHARRAFDKVQKTKAKKIRTTKTRQK